MGLAFIPYYIKVMGVEAYALVGIFLSLQALFAVLDMGLSQALNREMARLSAKPGAEAEMTSVVKTLELLYWFLAIVVALLIMSLSHWLSYSWLKPGELDRESIKDALLIISLVIGVRWPLTLYMGGMNGLQHQVSLNVSLVIFSTLQGVGSVVALWLVGPTVEVFFYWQAIISSLQVLVTRWLLWRKLPLSNGKVSFKILKGLWGFAFGMTGISLLSTLLTQLDKIVLSKFLSLEMFGYYIFASTVASYLFKLTSPVFTAYLPRFIQLASTERRDELARVYHQGSQLMALIVIPVASVMAFFSKDIIFFWTGNETLSSHSAGIVSILIVGNAINGLMNLPYALQLSFAWLKLTIYQTLISLVFLIFFIFWGVTSYGPIGAAYAWLALSLYSLLVTVYIMHRRLLKGEMSRWYIDSVFIPASVGGGVSYILSLQTHQFQGWEGIFYVGLSGLITALCVLISLSASRERIVNYCSARMRSL